MICKFGDSISRSNPLRIDKNFWYQCPFATKNLKKFIIWLILGHNITGKYNSAVMDSLPVRMLQK